MSGQGSKVSSIADPALLNKIDKLFVSGVEEYVFLPQIVAVGDQSSGKSSVLDVPGIFRKTTEGITTRADKETVEAMVRRYMENPRSIILAVIPANVDICSSCAIEAA